MLDKSKGLLIRAIEQEVDTNGFYETINCGIGKLNAALALQAYFSVQDEELPEFILNVGTCGGIKKKDESPIVHIDAVCDRDFNKEYLEELRRHSPTLCPILRIPTMRPGRVCLSGDTFVTKIDNPHVVYDMELYGLATVAKDFEIPIYSIKYISDMGSFKDWEKSLKTARQALNRELHRIFE